MKTATGCMLTSRTTAEVQTFDTDGRAVSLKDKDGNRTAISYTSGRPSKVTATQGSEGARTANITYGADTGDVEKFAQTSSGNSRSASFARDPYGANLGTFTDPTGKCTRFAYEGNLLKRVTSPAGAMISFTYDSQNKVTAIEQTNTGTGSPGNSVTRISYTSAVQTLLAGPNTDQNAPVTSVPRTTYTE